MVLLLTNEELSTGVLSSPDAVERSIEMMEVSFKALTDGTGVTNRPGTAVGFPPDVEYEHEYEIALHAPMGILKDLNAMAGSFTPIGKRGTSRQRFALLFDYTTLELIAIMGNSAVHAYQVGAQVGVGTKYLAREDARTVGVIGSSKMAFSSLRAICAVRPIERVVVFSPTEVNRVRFATDASNELGVNVTAVDSPAQACRELDIVTCATNNWVRGGGKVLEAEWVSPGTHVNTISRSELGEDAAWIGRVFPATTESVTGAVPPWEPWQELLGSGRIGDHLGPQLTEIVAGKAPGRADEDEITVYLGANLGTHRVAIDLWAYIEATSRGLGTEWAGGD